MGHKMLIHRRRNRNGLNHHFDWHNHDHIYTSGTVAIVISSCLPLSMGNLLSQQPSPLHSELTRLSVLAAIIYFFGHSGSGCFGYTRFQFLVLQLIECLLYSYTDLFLLLCGSGDFVCSPRRLLRAWAEAAVQLLWHGAWARHWAPAYTDPLCRGQLQPQCLVRSLSHLLHPLCRPGGK